MSDFKLCTFVLCSTVFIFISLPIFVYIYIYIYIYNVLSYIYIHTDLKISDRAYVDLR